MKKFLIIGNANAITYKEIFPYIASGEWFIRTKNGTVCFAMNFTNSNGENKIISSVWFTNLDSRHLYKTLELTKTYDPEKYPKYDNYDAIEVSRIKDIPYDYDGVMGVPISIVLFSPYQFSIVDSRDYAFRAKDINEIVRPYVDGKEIYRRVLNQNSNPLAPGEVSAYVNNHKKYCRVFNKNSDVHNPLAGGGAVDGKLTFKRIPIRLR